MQIAISEVPSSLLTSASFWPTSGSMAALAKWNSTAQAAKISSGRLCSSTREARGLLVASLPSRRRRGRAPRRCRWRRPGSPAWRRCWRRPARAISQNTTIGPNAVGEAAGDAAAADGVAGMVEGLVAADAAGERLRADDAERDRRHRGREHRAGGRRRCACVSGHRRRSSEERQGERAQRHRRGQRRSRLPRLAVCGRSARRPASGPAGPAMPADRHHEADRGLVPVLHGQQVDGEVGPEPVAHVGQEES